MKQIVLSPLQANNNAITGKIVKDISYLRGDYCQKPQLIITFTDDTYIYLTAKTDENNNDAVIFKNAHITPLECYSNPPGNVITDDNGKQTFKYVYNIEEQILLGLIKPDREKEIIKIQEHEEFLKKREYELYLELKKKYE